MVFGVRGSRLDRGRRAVGSIWAQDACKTGYLEAIGFASGVVFWEGSIVQFAVGMGGILILEQEEQFLWGRLSSWLNDWPLRHPPSKLFLMIESNGRIAQDTLQSDERDRAGNDCVSCFYGQGNTHRSTFLGRRVIWSMRLLIVSRVKPPLQSIFCDRKKQEAGSGGGFAWIWPICICALSWHRSTTSDPKANRLSKDIQSSFRQKGHCEANCSTRSFAPTLPLSSDVKSAWC